MARRRDPFYERNHIELLISALIFILIAGVIYYFAERLFPHPVPLIVLAVIVLFALIWLLGAADSADFSFGDNDRR